MKTTTLLSVTYLIMLLTASMANAEAPDPAFLLNISHSVAKVHVYNAQNQLGVGSSVVVAPNQVATNCHVLANARGIAINKLGNSYAPIGMKADWQHDLCILVFERLPLKPLSLGKLDLVQDYERPIIALGFSGSSPRPTRSYGHIKALIPFDNSHLIQSSSGFSLGASGGALINYEGELLGITTFKSPRRHGHYFSLPVSWIRQLLSAEMLPSTTPAQAPFWDTPANKRPLFMQAVSLQESKDWAKLEKLASQWTTTEPDNAEAWFYLGEAHKAQRQYVQAKQSYEQSLNLIKRHGSSLVALAEIASIKGNTSRKNQLLIELELLNPLLVEQLNSIQPVD